MTEETSCSTCEDSSCSASEKKPNERESEFAERQAIASRMCRIKHKLVVLSGKGGVGKSTVAVNLAAALSSAGKKVGLLDIDIHGPSIPKLLHIENATITGSERGMQPVELGQGLKVMSIGLLMRGPDEPVIWRGPMKHTVIRQFLTDVEWGELDYLVVDSPPGTGDEPLSIAQLIQDPDGAIIVTTPQELALLDVRRSIMFCRQLGMPVLGVIENMSGFVCPHCSEQIELFGSGGGKAMAGDIGVPFLGAIPLDSQVVASGDRGEPVIRTHPQSQTSKAFALIARSLLGEDPETVEEQPPGEKKDGEPMKIAIPVASGALCLHFGHSEQFALFEVDPEGKTIKGKQMLTPPPHEPGVLPRWLQEQGADVVITGGMGSRAQGLFAQNNIKVVVGVAAEDPERVVRNYLDGNLQAGANVCDH